MWGLLNPPVHEPTRVHVYSSHLGTYDPTTLQKRPMPRVGYKRLHGVSCISLQSVDLRVDRLCLSKWRRGKALIPG